MIESDSAAEVRAKTIMDILKEEGLSRLPEGAPEQLEQFLNLLVRWSQRLNLTSDRDPRKIVRRHFVESIDVARFLNAEVTTLLDFGSGAGFPGIPLAICRPEIQITLAESQAKKAAFLSEAVRRLGLRAEVYRGRVEYMAPDRRFGAVVLRAVDKSPTALPLAAERSQNQLLWITGGQPATLAGKLVPAFQWEPPTGLRGLGGSVLVLAHRLEKRNG